LVVHAQPTLFLESLTRALARRGHTVQGASPDPFAAVDLVPRFGSDLCLLDAVEESRCVGAARRLRDRLPDVKIVVLRGERSRTVRRAFDTEVVDAVVDRACVFEQLDSIVMRTVRGGRCLVEGDNAAAQDAGPSPTLTRREHQVLGLLVRGATTYAMAEELGISRYTVRTHVQGLMRKLDVHERERAVSVALSRHLLEGASR
jgi:DNA-binding NarL/FixJ family response regulator